MPILYQKQSDFIRCLACSHFCSIASGKHGICGVRENSGSTLELLVYGRPCAIHIDPIEKKPLYHFLPGTEVLSLGTFGCNFGCGFCQNWDISQVSKKDAAGSVKNWRDFLKTLAYAAPEKMVEMAKQKNIPSIAYTYNEPTIWTEYAMDIARLAQNENIKNIYVSNGYMSEETCDYVKPYLDAINIDLKSFRDEFYIKTCKGRLQPVLDNIKRLYNMGIWVEITTLIIPDSNDSAEELEKIAVFIASVNVSIPWHLSAFHPDYQMPNAEATGYKKLLEACKIGKQAGLKYVYIGNIKSEQYANTYCPTCGETLIEREYMTAKIGALQGNKCLKCKNEVAGVF